MTFVSVSIYLHEFLCSNSANYIDFSTGVDPMEEEMCLVDSCSSNTVLREMF